MRPEGEEIWILNWLPGFETILLELVFHLLLTLLVYLYWSLWPLTGYLQGLVLCSFALRLRNWNRWRHQEMGLRLSTNRVVLTQGHKAQVLLLCNPMWWSPLCLVIAYRRTASGTAQGMPGGAAAVWKRLVTGCSGRLVVWRHRVGEENFRRLRRELKTFEVSLR